MLSPNTISIMAIKTRTKNNPKFTKIRLSRKATEVLYEKMMFYNDKAKKILNALLDDIQSAEKADAKLRLNAMKQIKECDAVAIECAKLLAPYQDAKLQSIEMKTNVEHRYVFRAPAQMKSIEEWKQAVGAIDDEKVTHDFPVLEAPAKLTVHDADFDEIDDIEDQHRSLN